MINFALKQIREKTYHFFKEKNNKAMKMLQMLSSIKFVNTRLSVFCCL